LKFTDAQSHFPADRKLTLGAVLDDLLTDQLITRQDFDDLQFKSSSKEGVTLHPLVVVANHNIHTAALPHRPLTLETLTQWLAEKCGLSYERIDPLKIDVTVVTAVMSYAYAERNKILPIGVAPDEVVVATAEPNLTSRWQDELERVLRKRVVCVIANPTDISRYLVEFYSVSRSVLGATKKSDAATPSDITNLEQLIDLSKSGQLDSNDQHVISIVDWLLQFAFEQRASDIHLEPRRDTSNIRFRIDGVLHLVYQLPTPVMAAVVSRIKILGRMDLAEKRRPLDGRMKTKNPDGTEVELRLSTMPTAFGEKLVMRIFNPDVLVKNFKQLGLSGNDATRWEAMIKQPHGIILVTGPTGSGKTTTLYSTLKRLAKPEINICTIEDPIEMVEPQFNQMQVQHNLGLDFASGVRALLRQDPDVVMVGEIRDLETAEMAIQTALTGHLVISTLHTNDATSAITRLLDIGVPAYLISSTILGIAAQRLVRTLCPHCKRKQAPDAELWRTLSRPWKINMPETVYGPAGCLECRNTGFSGRMGIYEMLTMSPAIRKMVVPNCDIAQIVKQALQEEMKPLRISGIRKVHAGLTSLEEVARVTPPFTED